MSTKYEGPNALFNDVRDAVKRAHESAKSTPSYDMAQFVSQVKTIVDQAVSAGEQ